MARIRSNQPMTKEMLLDLFSYRDGMLFWKKSPRYRINAGDRAGGVHGKAGYRKVRVQGIKEFEHRVIFMMHHGWLPKFLDHIDGDPGNNRIENLRGADYRQNASNRKIQSNNKSGYRGVWFCKNTGTYLANIGARKNARRLGTFATAELASAAYEVAAKEMYGDYVREIKFSKDELIAQEIVRIFKERGISPSDVIKHRDRAVNELMFASKALSGKEDKSLSEKAIATANDFLMVQIAGEFVSGKDIGELLGGGVIKSLDQSKIDDKTIELF